MFEQLKQAKVFIEILQLIQTLDADEKDGPDIKQFISLASKLVKETDDVKRTVAEIEALVGADIEAIKAKFNIKD